MQRINCTGPDAAGARDDTERMPPLLLIFLNRLPQVVQRYTGVVIDADPSDGIRSKSQELDCFLNAGVHLRGGIEPERSEEHTSELQSHLNLVCRLLLEKKKQPYIYSART